MVERQDPEGGDTLTATYDLLGKVGKKFRDLHRSLVQKYGLTLSQYCILSHLWAEDGQPLKQLAIGCHITRSTATGVVETLRKKALVTREESADDRRSKLIHLTDTGQALQVKAPTSSSLQAKCTMDQGEIRLLNGLLDKLYHSLGNIS